MASVYDTAMILWEFPSLLVVHSNEMRRMKHVHWNIHTSEPPHNNCWTIDYRKEDLDTFPEHSVKCFYALFLIISSLLLYNFLRICMSTQSLFEIYELDTEIIGRRWWHPIEEYGCENPSNRWHFSIMQLPSYLSSWELPKYPNCCLQLTWIDPS